MSKFMSLIAKAPKRLVAAVLVLAAVVAIPALSSAWGPTRDTFTIEHPADHVTFNSITNNPNIGDERNFVGIREVGSASTWYDTMKVQDGKEYYVRMYVHNNAASNLNLVAHDVTAKFNLPTTTGTSIQVDGFVNSTNATPKEVYDSATFTGDTNFNLSYVKGSLQYENNKGTFTLPESIFTSAGAKLGYNQMDGDIPGCFQYSGFVTFKVKPQIAKSLNFTLTKKVSKHGANQWSKSYAAQPGETVDYLLVYKNVGTAQNDDVTFRDTLPTGLSYVAKSGTWSNVLTQNVPFVNDAALTNGTGINVGSYATGANAYIIFSAKVATEDKLPCGPSTLTNKAKVNTGGYSVEDTADVTVNRTCVQPPVYTCDLLTKTLVTGTQYKFSGKASASNGANITGYTLDFGDGSTPYTGTSVTDVNHTYPQANKSYTARLTATVKVDGSTKTVTSDACAVKIDVSCPPVKIQVCDLATKKVITINESDFDAKKHSKNLDDCKPIVKIQVCDLATKKVITINEKDFDAKKHSKNLDDCKPPKQIQVCDLATKKVITINESDFDAKKHSKNLDDCKPPKQIQVCDLATNTVVTINESDFDESKYSKDIENCKPPVKITVCDLTTKQVVSIDEKDFDAKKYSKNLDDCKSTPMCTVPGKEHLPADSKDCVATPPELPHTGIGDGIVTTFGIGSLIASASYYIASRRGLNR